MKKCANLVISKNSLYISRRNEDALLKWFKQWIFHVVHRGLNLRVGS